ncbi:MAG: hypothetical protein GXP55_07805, partial [Deltaproteobacteria bacterium]|nr:hypothetical protein [Deltaproteobacteria bacterium]
MFVRRHLAISVAVCTLLLSATHANAQTVADIAARGACSTAGVENLSAQLAEAQSCMRPDAFVPFAPYPNITLTSSRVHAFVQASARDAIQAAADATPLSITSAFRTVADQYVLYNSGGCGLAARPGRSNHQSGRAVDLSNASAARAALEAQGCVWFGSRDPVHFDCPGMDLRADAITAFQHLWNVNNPGDTIAEDGAYGAQTDARLAGSPAGGFSDTGCGCMPGCDGSAVIMADCSRVACDAADTCRAGACVFEGCAGGRVSVCVDATTFGSCVMGDLGMTTTCAAGCVEDADGARCDGTPDVDAGFGDSDAGVTDDGGVNDASVTDDAGGRMGGVVSGGCGCRA